jgi:hypothetical protein
MSTPRSSRTLALAALCAVLLAPSAAQAQLAARAGRALAAGVDVVIVRPLGFVALVVGAVAFVPVALIAAPQGRDGFEQAWEQLVEGPAEHVFVRPIGEL